MIRDPDFRPYGLRSRPRTGRPWYVWAFLAAFLLGLALFAGLTLPKVLR